MNPEMMRQMMERMAAQRASAPTQPRSNMIEDLLDMLENMRGEYDGPVRPNPADAPARDPQGRKLTPMGKVGPSETESAGKDAAMLNRAREMARRAAMQRILSSEDIPPSPTR